MVFRLSGIEWKFMGPEKARHVKQLWDCPVLIH